MIEKGSRWWNDGINHKRQKDHPGEGWVEGRIFQTRRKRTPEQCRAQSERLKGTEPWNKGLTGIYSEETLAKMSIAKEGYIPWNAGLQHGYTPWNKKPDDHHSPFRKYRYQVSYLSEKTYVEYYEEINPNCHPRTQAGVPGGYQLDHIISISYGFENNIPAEDLAKKENLRIITWEENVKKGNR